MMRICLKFVVAMGLVAVIAVSCSQRRESVLRSPDGKLSMSFSIDNGQPVYRLKKEGIAIIQSSKMGFDFVNMASLGTDFGIAGTDTASLNETWEQPWGESRFVVNRYNELVVHLQEKGGQHRKLDVIFRLFDDGLGFRYHFPSQPGIDSLIIADEKTEFVFGDDHKAWWIPVHSDNSYYESLPRHTFISEVDTINTPVTMQLSDSLYIAIHEANLTDYASMTLRRAGHTSFISELVPWANGIKVYAKAPFSTPWRIVLVGEKPGDLITSHLMLNLNDPCKIEDTGWIKPSKYIGIWWGMHMEKYTWGQGPKHGATTANAMKYMDFAARHGFRVFW
ncbi:MAG: glycoside hydrolase family 97 N-terminal domain-containing protein [Breznakibacter sp.]